MEELARNNGETTEEATVEKGKKEEADHCTNPSCTLTTPVDPQKHKYKLCKLAMHAICGSEGETINEITCFNC